MFFYPIKAICLVLNLKRFFNTHLIILAAGVIIVALQPSPAIGQTNDSIPSGVADSLSDPTLSRVHPVADSLMILRSDSLLLKDSDSALILSNGDSNKGKAATIESPVTYKAADSIRFNIPGKKIYMHKGGEVYYQKISLKADYIEPDFNTNVVFAQGVTDSTGKTSGEPVFTEGDQSFRSEKMSYNFTTKKGVIRRVITKEGEGYLHGAKVKKMPDNTVNIQGGSYTTCNLDHPHFEFRFNKSKVIPDNKIITGPAHLVIEGVSTPLFIPFGLFPNKKGQKSGIVIPTYGESANRGFYFENGGYYWAISDYMDLEMLGDIYTRGSWALKPNFRYVKRYKYSGNLNLNLARNVTGDEGTPTFSDNRDFAIRWSHRQDPKARPNSTFSASVNIVSNSYNKYNPTSTANYLSNQFQSSISYQTNFDQKYFLTLNANHSQNTLNKTVSVTLPSLTFSANRFYPFRAKKQVGSLRWYENITVSYTANAENRINTYDSLLFDRKWASRMANGLKQAVPVSSSVKVLKFFTLTNSVNLTERWYYRTIRKEWVPDTTYINGVAKAPHVAVDTVDGFAAAHEFNVSSSLNTRLYGMLSFKRGPVLALRHVISPSISFSWRPDFSDPWWGYYKTVQNSANGSTTKYSIFEQSIYGGPGAGKSGSIGFSLSNNLEMKVKSKSDTITGTRKIKLIENFTLSGSYNLAADSLRWSTISMNGRTTLFKNLTLNYRSTWDPYILDSAGTRRLNVLEWERNRRLFRLENTNWSFSLNWNLRGGGKKDPKQVGKPGQPEDPRQMEIAPDDPEMADIYYNPDNYVDFNVPWSLNIAYSFSHTSDHAYPNYQDVVTKKLVQTLNFSGDVSLTPKWKVSFTTGFDFENHKITYTTINIFRDLHCWEMRFNWIPIGTLKSWNFQINVKSSILQDLKLTKKKDFRDR